MLSSSVQFGKLDSKDSLDLIDWDLPPWELPPSDLDPQYLKAEVRLGVPGWAHPTWRGGLFPQKAKVHDFLSHYAQSLSVVELNTSYYAIPRTDRILGWCERVPDDFEFCPKWPLHISNALKDLKPEPVRAFEAALGTFGAKLGVSFLQLPQYFGISDLKYLTSFLEMRDQTYPLAIEFRHKTFFEAGYLKPTVAQALEALNVSLVCSDTPTRRDVTHLSLAGQGVFMLRFLGSENAAVDARRLRFWTERLKNAPKILGRSLKVYMFLHQPDNLNLESGIRSVAHDLDLPIGDKRKAALLKEPLKSVRGSLKDVPLDLFSYSS